MLRITRRAEDDSVCLLLEGNLSGPWVRECDRVCATEAAAGANLALDLSGVRYADAAGLAFVRSRAQAGEVRRTSGFVAELLRSASPVTVDRDESAESAFVRRHAGSLLALARSLLRQEGAARTVVERAFGSALAEAGAADELTLASRLRRLVGEGCSAVLGARGSSVSSERVAEAVRQHHHPVRRCIDALPDDDRVVLLCCDVAGLETREMAAALGIPIATVEQRLGRARRALMALLRPSLVA